MPINLGLPPAPKLEGSLLPYLANLAARITAALGQTSRNMVGTVANRPAAALASPGDIYYATDEAALYYHNGIDWIIPYPLGLLGRNTLTANSAYTTAIIYPLSVTSTIRAGRKIKVTSHANLETATAANVGASLGVCDNAGTIANQAYKSMALVNNANQLSVSHIWQNLAAGSYTFRMSLFANFNTRISATGTAYAFMDIEDLGPI